jgi:hypothetical protein
MWHHNKKNPLITTPAKAPAKPNPVNETAQAEPKPSPQTSTIKVGSPEIRIGLDGAATRSGMIGKDMLKPSFPKKVTMNIAKPKVPKGIKMPKVKIPKVK